MIDCSRFVPSRCRANCCGSQPMDKDLLKNNKDKYYVLPVGFQTYSNDMVEAVTHDKMCVFLNRLNFKCEIYHDRPKICNMYGDESHERLRCPFQDKNGKERSDEQILKIHQEKVELLNSL